jgi:hypothetical protein
MKMIKTALVIFASIAALPLSPLRAAENHFFEVDTTFFKKINVTNDTKILNLTYDLTQQSNGKPLVAPERAIFDAANEQSKQRSCRFAQDRKQLFAMDCGLHFVSLYMDDQNYTLAVAVVAEKGDWLQVITDASSGKKAWLKHTKDDKIVSLSEWLFQGQLLQFVSAKSNKSSKAQLPFYSQPDSAKPPKCLCEQTSFAIRKDEEAPPLVLGDYIQAVSSRDTCHPVSSPKITIACGTGWIHWRSSQLQLYPTPPKFGD